MNAMWDKTCEVCGRQFTAARRDAKTCSPACSQKAYRDRKEETALEIDHNRLPFGSTKRAEHADFGEWLANLNEQTLRHAAAGVLLETGNLDAAAALLDGAGFRVPYGYFSSDEIDDL